MVLENYIRVVTRHDEQFDIYTTRIHPAKSRYATYFASKFPNDPDRYARRLNSFFDKLGVKCCIWASLDVQRPEHYESCKPIEYVLEVRRDRVLAFVDENAWDEYLEIERDSDFCAFSTKLESFKACSVLIEAPITVNEVVYVYALQNRRGKAFRGRQIFSNPSANLRFDPTTCFNQKLASRPNRNLKT